MNLKVLAAGGCIVCLATGCQATGALQQPSVPNATVPPTTTIPANPIAAVGTYYGFYQYINPDVAQAIADALTSGDMTELESYEGQGIPELDQAIQAVQNVLNTQGPIQCTQSDC